MFTKYSSLENHTNNKFLDKVWYFLDENQLRNVEFVAREKIHGTNFSVIITKDSIQAAKRTGPILETEKFFGYEDLMARYKDSFKYIQANTLIQNGWTYQVFGEYAGGNIQKEVDYGDKDLYVFDVLVTSPDGELTYAKDSHMVVIAENAGLKVAPLIKRGTLEELLKLPVEFESVIGEYNEMYKADGTYSSISYEHEQRAPASNVAEGLVIKPERPITLPGGSRLAIKYKTDAFKEKGKGKAPKIVKEMEQSDIDLLDKFSEYVTPARVGNVISHIGELTKKDFGKILGLTMRDIFVEAEREGLTIDQAISPSRLKGELQKIVQTQVREVWVTLDIN